MCCPVAFNCSVRGLSHPGKDTKSLCWMLQPPMLKHVGSCDVLKLGFPCILYFLSWRVSAAGCCEVTGTRLRVCGGLEKDIFSPEPAAHVFSAAMCYQIRWLVERGDGWSLSSVLHAVAIICFSFRSLFRCFRGKVQRCEATLNPGKRFECCSLCHSCLWLMDLHVSI